MNTKSYLAIIATVAFTSTSAWAQTTDPVDPPVEPEPTIQEIVNGIVTDLTEQGVTNIEVRATRRGIQVEGFGDSGKVEYVYDTSGNLRKSEVNEGIFEVETIYDAEGNVIKSERKLNDRIRDRLDRDDDDDDDDHGGRGRGGDDDRDDDRDDRDDDRDDRDDDRDDRDDDRDDRDDDRGRDRD